MRNRRAVYRARCRFSGGPKRRRCFVIFIERLLNQHELEQLLKD